MDLYRQRSLFLAVLVSLAFHWLTATDDEPTTNFDGTDYLKSYGYLHKNYSKTDEPVRSWMVRKALNDFQRFSGMPLTDRLDEQTRNQMISTRCGVKDKPKRQHHRVRRFALQGTKWNKKVITWKIEQPSRKLDSQLVRSLFYHRIKLWQAVLPLKIIEVVQNPDISIQFVTGAHGDLMKFEGKGGDLAHAFYPLDNSLGQPGDIHVDDDEDFAGRELRIELSPKKTSLAWVLLHEFGHSLGLEHSERKDSLMYPWYTQGISGDKVQLTPDDRVAVMMLYGPPELKSNDNVVRFPSESYPVLENRVRAFCLDQVDVIFQYKPNRTVVQFSNQLYLLDNRMRYVDGPFSANELLPGFNEAKIDAVVNRNDDRMVVYSGSRFYFYTKAWTPLSVYSLKNIDNLPQNISHVDAVFRFPYDNVLYLLSGEHYWVLDHFFRVKESQPGKIFMKWPGFPSNISAAYVSNKSKLYFFKGSQFYRYDEVLQRVHPAYPRDIRTDWFGCEPRASSGFRASLKVLQILYMLVLYIMLTS